MRNLLAFLLKNHFFLYFIFLEVLSFMLIYESSNYQRATIFNTANSVTGGLNRTFTNVTEYFQLKKANQALAEQNARLLSELSAEASIKKYYPQADTSLHFLSARVISNSIQMRNNFFMIDKGRNDGLKQDMGVISPGGVAGIIVAVSADYSVCMSVLHKDFRVSGRISKNKQLVNVVWNGLHYTTGVVEDIPTHINLNPGDSVITSGNSFIFPEGIPIGMIKNYLSKGEGLFDKARILFSTDFNSLYFVYVVRNPKQDEMNQLLIESTNKDEK